MGPLFILYSELNTMEFEILDLRSREVLDSRGNPTIEVEVRTKSGVSRAMVPSGASTGIHEALELRDKDERFLGKGVQKAVMNVNETIAKKLVNSTYTTQEDIDNIMIELDGTPNKANLGANAILGVSMALVRASALEEGIPLHRRIADLAGNNKLLLPVPSMNVINGGEHAGNSLDIQEYMILPTKAESFKEAIRMGSETYQTLKGIIKEKYGANAINVGDEGGFAPPLAEPEEPLELITKAVEELGYQDRIMAGMDVAASEFYRDGKYVLKGDSLSGEELSDRYKELIDSYPVISIEDPFAQDDWNSWVEFTGKFTDRIQIVGDDLLVTNVERIKLAMEKNACNALLLKVNQIGSITESINAANISFKNGWRVMVSHRSGETEDSFIADLSVGLGTGQIKAGAPCRSERNAKYNQLIRIEEELKENAKYGGIL